MTSAPRPAGRRAARRRTAATLATALALLLATAWLPACGERERETTPPERVLLIVLDATHAAHLGSYGGPPGLVPRLDALAERGRRFSRAVSNNTWTRPSTVSLMTGQLQERHGVVTNRHKVDEAAWLLADHFTAAGWDTAAFVEMIYASSVHGLEQGFDHYRYYSLTAGPHPFALVTDVADWMDAQAGRRWFAYLHLRRPHSPYDPSAPARLRVEGDCELADGREDARLAHADSRVEGPLDDAERAHVEHLYRANLASADDQLADVLARAARDPGLLVVLTSDHGEALGQHGRYGHGYDLLAENVDVPLVFAGTGVTPGVDDGPASTIDVAPTLLELCGLPALPPGVTFDGASLADRVRGETPPARDRAVPLSARYVGAGAVPRQGVVWGSYKLVLEQDGTVVLHDRAVDPDETRDVSPEHPDIVERLLPLALARRDAGAELAERDTQDIPVHEAELRALGYLR